jgi:hypothetical protein
VNGAAWGYEYLNNGAGLFLKVISSVKSELQIIVVLYSHYREFGSVVYSKKIKFWLLACL